MNIFSRLPSWLYTALNLVEPKVPNVLDVGAVIPTIDAFQSGFPDSSFQVIPASQPPSSGPSNPILIDTQQLNPDHQFRVIALHCSHTGGAGPAGPSLILIANTGVGAYVVGPIPLAVGQLMGHKEIFGTVLPLWVPNGCNLRCDFPATGVGESFSLQLIAQRIRKEWRIN